MISLSWYDLFAMIEWQRDIEIYLHREPVDFRKAINGLSVIVEEMLEISPFSQALFVFCNKRRTQLKVLYWDETGFALWQKRLEKERFKWPKQGELVITLSHEQWLWLLRGFNVFDLKPHQKLAFSNVN